MRFICAACGKTLDLEGEKRGFARFAAGHTPRLSWMARGRTLCRPSIGR